MPDVTSHAPGAFCWIELGTTDQKAAKEFYGKLFGWTFVDMPMGEGAAYTMFKLKGRDVGAAYTLDPRQHPGVPPHWMIYVATADADATAKRSAELGGEVTAAAFDVLDVGRMAVLKDPTGAVCSVWQARKHTGMGLHNEPGSFCWGQLNTNDTAKAEAFYRALFGWNAKMGSDGGMTYTEWMPRRRADRRDDGAPAGRSGAAPLACVLRGGRLRRDRGPGGVARSDDPRTADRHSGDRPIRGFYRPTRRGVRGLPCVKSLRARRSHQRRGRIRETLRPRGQRTEHHSRPHSRAL